MSIITQMLHGSSYIEPPKGAKVYPASRRRSNKKVGLKGQLAPHCVMIKKFYHGIQKAVHQFRFKNVEQHLLLGFGGGGGEPKSKTQL